MVLGRLTENTQKNGNQHRNFEIEIPKQTMDSVATVPDIKYDSMSLDAK
jgi:hypothetical protein